ncbi:MAG: tRNA 4-thiouridine(8) synthase ThiI [Proteobacteria bacterium]|nr:tRNA 4-thiouridine(8) synthase ThiI [Pseudomonadota bacterium]
MTDTPYSGPGVLLRIGELFLKRGNRHIFFQALLANVQRALKGRDDIRISHAMGRIYIEGASDEDLLRRLRWVFGLTSISPGIFCDPDIDVITPIAVDLARTYPGGPETRFRVAARRADKTFPLNSGQIGAHVGGQIHLATGFRVDLEQPDLSVGVEVGLKRTFIWARQLPGGGGLPVGTAGKVALLLSGGLDSPVAGHMLQKRGVELTGIYFHAAPYTSDGAKEKVIALARILAARQRRFQLLVVPFAPVQEALRDIVDPTWLVLLYRRAMVRIAEIIARDEGISCLATGESVGQVASQTLANIATVEDAASLLVLRPVIAMDKAEIIRIARDIDTYETSILPHDDCCTLFTPRHPQTRGRADLAQRYEARLPHLDQLLQTAAEAAERILL